tara:strand:- start:2291 stop:2542 length:252 start_codon:yes stop_codon:yes gene_type:complete
MAHSPKEWREKQITEGGLEKAIGERVKPLFTKTSTALGTKLIDPKVKAYLKLNPLDILRYPPVEKLPEINVKNNLYSFTIASD